MNVMQSAVATGSCLTLTHNWNTHAVAYSAWMATTSGAWVPVVPGYDPGVTNVALNKSAQALSSNSPSYPPSNGNDGDITTCWVAPNGTLPWYQVDLGQITTIGTVKFNPAPPNAATYCGATLAWDLELSNDGTSFTAPITHGTCQYPGSCQTTWSYDLPAGSSGRFVRIVPTSATCSTPGNAYALVCELQAYSANYTVSQPDTNTLKLCNYTGATRDMALIAWH